MISTRAALVWSFVGRYIAIVLGLVTSIALARLLTPAEIGKYSLCAAALAIASVIRDFGISDYIIQERELTKDKLRSAFGLSLVIAWSIGLVVLLLRHPIADYYKEPLLVDLIAVLSINYFILPIGTPVFALFNREMAFDKIFAVQMSAAAAQSAASIALAALGYGAIGLCWAAVLGTAFQIACVALLRPADSLMLPKFSHAGGVIRFGAYSVASRMMDSGAANAHEFVLARVFGFSAVGLFSRAKGLIDLGSTNLFGAVNGVYMAMLSIAARNDEDLVPTFAKGTSIMTCIGWPFFGFIAVAAPEIVLVLFGAQWVAAGPIAAVLAISALPMPLWSLCPVTLSATGHVKRRMHISSIFNPIHLAALALLAFVGDLRVFAFAWFATNTAMTVLYTHHVRAILRSNIRALYGQSLPSFYIAVVTIAVMLAAMLACRRLDVYPIVSLLLTFAAGLGTWFVAIAQAQHPAHLEWLDLRSAIWSKAKLRLQVTATYFRKHT